METPIQSITTDPNGPPGRTRGGVQEPLPRLPGDPTQGQNGFLTQGTQQRIDPMEELFAAPMQL